MPPATGYVHGYSARESVRLTDQATALTDLLHAGTSYPRGSRVLEAGCGTGAQTIILAGRSAEANFTSIDVSGRSLAEARRRVRLAGHANVRFLRADVFGLPFEPSCFDHIFVCFVLEHLSDPAGALRSLMTVLKPGGSITVIEGDHGSAYFHPASDDARRVIQCLVDLQRQAGGDSLIGRRLYPLLASVGYRDIQVTPRMVYADGSRPDLADGVTLKTFTAMVEGVAAQAIGEGLLDAATWAAGIADLRRAAAADGTFCYTFFTAKALRLSGFSGRGASVIRFAGCGASVIRFAGCRASVIRVCRLSGFGYPAGSARLDARRAAGRRVAWGS